MRTTTLTKKIILPLCIQHSLHIYINYHCAPNKLTISILTSTTSFSMKTRKLGTLCKKPTPLV
jgi:hypothetical protein